MIVQHKQKLESFVRVRAFLDAHPVTGPLGYGNAREILDDVVPRLREYAGAQVTGRRLSSAERRRQAQLERQLIVHHMRPLVTVARVQLEPASDVRMPEAIRMPKAGIGVTKLLQACDGMIAAARPFEAEFIAHGLPADFLARFTAARNELEAVLGERAAFVDTHVGAAAGMRVQIARGRRAVNRIDVVVRAAFDGDEVTLTQWRAAKRVRLMPAVAGGRGAEVAAVPGEAVKAA